MNWNCTGTVWSDWGYFWTYCGALMYTKLFGMMILLIRRIWTLSRRYLLPRIKRNKSTGHWSGVCLWFVVTLIFDNKAAIILVSGLGFYNGFVSDRLPTTWLTDFDVNKLWIYFHCKAHSPEAKHATNYIAVLGRHRAFEWYHFQALKPHIWDM